jgi:2-polyprenyl-3-methyl-5-hydroxy-6-metoxy-1,4-benzoquinol methylase
MYKRQCFLCESKKLKKFLDLGLQPWCNDFLKKSQLGKEKKYPLYLNFCENCSNVQLGYILSKNKMFSDHYYLSGTSEELVNHFKKISLKIYNFFSNKKISILDIGSNDGTFLKNFKNNKNNNIIGIESCKKIAQLASKQGITTINKFFNYKTALKLDKKQEGFDCIHASGVFFHLEEIKSVTRGIKYILKNDGVFIIQFLYLKSIIEKSYFDQIYHEHLNYYNIKPLERFLNSYDLEIFDAEKSNIHGGSIIAYVCHKGLKKKTKRFLNLLKLENQKNVNDLKFYLNFQYNIKKLKSKLIKKINHLKKKNFNIYGIGAPAKSNTLINFCGLNNNDIKFTTESNYLKFNKYLPVSHIKILDEKKILKKNFLGKHIFLIFTWNFKNKIIKKYKKEIGKNFKYFLPHL